MKISRKKYHTETRQNIMTGEYGHAMAVQFSIDGEKFRHAIVTYIKAKKASTKLIKTQKSILGKWARDFILKKMGEGNK